jgi:multiple sugar transport system permease protein
MVGKLALRPLSINATLLKSLPRYGLLVLGSGLTLLPFWVMVAIALSPYDLTQPLSLLPKTPTLTQLQQVVSTLPLGLFAINTLLVSLLVALGGLTLNALAGYALARHRFKASPLIQSLLWLSLIIPPQINIIPLFLVVKTLNGLNSHWALVLPALASSVAVLLYQRWFEDPQTYPLEEAATLEGASPWQCFWQVAFPLTLPLSISLGVLGFINTWNSFLWPLLVVQDDTLKTLPLALVTLKESFRDATNWPLLMAGACLSVLPVVVVFLVTQKHLVAGVSTGGLKE